MLSKKQFLINKINYFFIFNCIVIFASILVCILWPYLLINTKLVAGNDNLLPFFSDSTSRLISEWQDKNLGQYYHHNFYILKFFTYISEVFTYDIYKKILIQLILIRAFAALGLYLLLKLNNNNKFEYSSLLVFFIYFFTPSFYNGNIYSLFYSGIPWLFLSCHYLYLKKEHNYGILLAAISFFFLSADLPNPKYIFYGLITHLVFIFFSIKYKKINYNNLFKIFLKLCVTNLYIVLPLIFFLLNSQNQMNPIQIMRGYQIQNHTSLMLDYASSTVDKTVSLFHDNLTFMSELRNDYILNDFFIVARLVPFFLIVYFIYKKRLNLVLKIYISLMLIFLFFATGSNLPFGIIYQKIVTNFTFLAFLRTTAGAVFFVSLIYCVLAQEILKFFKQKVIYLLIFSSFITLSIPILNGNAFLYQSSNYYFNKNHYFKIPSEYFELKDFFSKIDNEANIYVPNSNLAYINLNWGFFGPGWFYINLFNKYFSSFDFIFRSGKLGEFDHYIFFDNNLENKEIPESAFNNIKYTRILFTDNLSLYKIKNPKYSGLVNALNINSSQDIPDIEFNRVSTTKFYIRVHNVKSDFRLLLTQAYNPGWRIYLSRNSDLNLGKTCNYTKDLSYHFDDISHASFSEINDYLTKNKLTPQNCYFPLYVSKNINTSIQNNNLKLYDKTPKIISNEIAKHQKFFIDDYMDLNLWSINFSFIKKNFNEYLVQNKDNSFDFDLIVEFFPQRVANFSAEFSILSILGIFFYILRKRNVKKKN